MRRTVVVAVLPSVIAIAGICNGGERRAREPSPAYEHLKVLEPFVGDWVFEGEAKDDLGGVKTGEPLKATYSFKWILNKAALRWAWALYSDGKLALRGIELVGWNGKEKTIVSYMVSNDGATDTGKWKVEGDKIVDKFSGARPDGTEFSGTVVFRVLDEDTVTWQAVGYSDGESEPKDTAVYKYKRQ